MQELEFRVRAVREGRVQTSKGILLTKSLNCNKGGGSGCCVGRGDASKRVPVKETENNPGLWRLQYCYTS